MPNYLYTDANGQKQGPIDDQQLQTLVAQGIVGPYTPLETEGGHQGVAGQIPGLFAASPFSAAQPAQAIPAPASKQSFCTNCANPISEQAVACMSCGAKPLGHRKFCRYCGTALGSEQVICVKCGAAIGRSAGKGLLGKLFGAK